jgi:hypothetical protein
MVVIEAERSGLPANYNGAGALTIAILTKALE